MSEEEVLLKLKNGSQAALKVLFDLYYKELTRYAIKIIGNVGDSVSMRHPFDTAYTMLSRTLNHPKEDHATEASI